MKRFMIPIILCILGGWARAAEFTLAERELMRQLGPGTPEPVPLWPHRPPQFLENAALEVIADHQTIMSVSVPTITPYLPPKENCNGLAVVVCAGGERHPRQSAHRC